jgi:hypothetical protein
MKAHEVVTKSPKSFTTGVLLGFLTVIFIIPIGDAVDATYDYLHPVVIEWRVTKVENVGDDVVLQGTMIKQRDCLYVPPTMARDQYGQNYVVESASPTAGVSWASGPEPQKWGPWIVRNAKGKTLAFSNTYVCDKNSKIVRLGVYVPTAHGG